MDIHHVLDHVYLKVFLNDDHKETGLSIALTSREHYVLTKARKKKFNSLQELFREEMTDLSNCTDIPDELAQSLKEFILQKYF